MIIRQHLFAFLVIVPLSMVDFSIAEGAMPKWVKNPGDFCDSSVEICAVGEGDTLGKSYSDARNEIAKQISVNVHSVYSSNISSDGNSAITLSNSDIEEITNETINGIEIRNTYHDNEGNFYSLAVLDKLRIIKDLISDIEKIDDELKVFLDGNISPGLLKVKKLYKKRSELAKKYLFMSGELPSKGITMSDVYKLRKENNFYGHTYNLKSNDERMAGFIAMKIFENGDFLSDDSQHYIRENNNEYKSKGIGPSKTDRVIVINTKVEKQHMNVKGFEKYKMFATITVYEGNKQICSLDFDCIASGRNFKQINEQLYNEILESINNRVEDLFV